MPPPTDYPPGKSRLSLRIVRRGVVGRALGGLVFTLFPLYIPGIDPR
jgi:hypothetical protein